MNHQADFVRENLRVGLEMLRAATEENISLAHYKQEPSSPECGTLYCAAGLFTTHPRFEKFITLQLVPRTGMWALKPVNVHTSEKNPVRYDGSLDVALDDLFGPLAWDDLFSSKWYGSRDREHPNYKAPNRDILVSDRDLAIWRIELRLEEFKNSTDAEIENYGQEI